MKILHEIFEAVMMIIFSEVLVYVNVTRNIRSRHVDNIFSEIIVYVNVTRVIRSHHVDNIE
jgi:hypothetical protein